MAKALKLSAVNTKYTGTETNWSEVDITDDNRVVQMMLSFNWYNYHFGHKDVAAFLSDYLKENKAGDAEIKLAKKIPVNSVPNAVAWLARMSLMGWKLTKSEVKQISTALSSGYAAIKTTTIEETEEDSEQAKVKKFNIQERMREKAAECGGELEGMLDDYIATGVKSKHTFIPINILKVANILPQHVPNEINFWAAKKAEFIDAQSDKELAEAYSQFTKTQLKNLVKFCELVISDLNSYVAYKKSTKKVPARRVKTPLEIVRKLKYMKEFTELKLKSVASTKIVGSKEMYVYNTKKRKLMYFVADEHAGNELVVKNNTIIGFDATKSVQKTLRKPKEQLKEMNAASKPNSRKVFNDIKSVGTKFSGRFSEDVIILKVY